MCKNAAGTIPKDSPLETGLTWSDSGKVGRQLDKSSRTGTGGRGGRGGCGCGRGGRGHGDGGRGRVVGGDGGGGRGRGVYVSGLFKIYFLT